jgi:hypothetical protein
VESGLFNGLQRIQTKNLLVQVFTKLRRNTRFSFVAQTRLALGSPGSKKTIAHIPIFEKTMRARDRGRWFMCEVRPFRMGGWWPGRGDGIRTQAAAAQDRAGPISWIVSFRAGHKVAAVKLREFFTRSVLASIQLN